MRTVPKSNIISHHKPRRLRHCRRSRNNLCIRLALSLPSPLPPRAPPPHPTSFLPRKDKGARRNRSSASSPPHSQRSCHHDVDAIATTTASAPTLLSTPSRNRVDTTSRVLVVLSLLHTSPPFCPTIALARRSVSLLCFLSRTLPLSSNQQPPSHGIRTRPQSSLGFPPIKTLTRQQQATHKHVIRGE